MNRRTQGPILKKISDAANIQNTKARKKAIADAIRELQEIEDGNQAAYESLLAKFNRDEETISDLEERIFTLETAIDEHMTGLQPGDWESNLDFVEASMPHDEWVKLDTLSRHYLAMAHYLHELLALKNADMSPAVLEYGRSFENELKKKIYDGYVEMLSQDNVNLDGVDRTYRALQKAVSSFSRTREYYLPARIMVRYLKNLGDSAIESQFNTIFKTFLDNNEIDKTKITDESFIDKADILFGEYRNSAAHPGTMLDLNAADDCKHKTKYVIDMLEDAIE